MRRFMRAVMGAVFVLGLAGPVASYASDKAIPAQEAVRAALEVVEVGQIAERTGVGMTLDKATQRFYEDRDFEPAWNDPKKFEKLLIGLRGMSEDGLDPEDYAYSRIITAREQLKTNDTALARATLDVLATRAFIHALFQLNRGKLDPDDLTPRTIDAPAELKRILDGINRGFILETFDLARPSSVHYAALRKALATFRDLEQAGGWPEVPEGPTLKLGMVDPRVQILVKRLIIGGYLAPETLVTDDIYDRVIVDAVKSFQTDYYLEPDGAMGAATRNALNIPVSQRIDQLRVNLERARQLLESAKGEFVLVDIAGYKVSYYRDDKPVWQSRVQVGKPFRQTPEFQSKITYITINPTWTVPPTILKNDVLPKVRANIGYLAANHMRVLNSKGQEISASSVNWNNPRGVIIRQDAGPWGALGQVAIRFPNPYAVYLHDTPNQALFDKAQRDFSSGCIRTERPFELVHLLFRAEDEAAQKVISDAVASGKTQTMTLPKPIPLMMIYWTVDIRENGRVTFRPDIYKRDPKILSGLNKRETL